MKRMTITLIIVLASVTILWAQSSRVTVIHAKKFDVSKPLRDMIRPVSENVGDLAPREMRNRLPEVNDERRGTRRVDPAWQRDGATRTNGPTLQNFEGANNLDNAAVVGFRVAPPDVNMDVGPNHVVQMVNLVSEIFDKSGNSLLGPFDTSDLWNGFGGNCELNNDGDPIVLYDPLADRWLLSQFVFSSDQCVAISTTPDPTGSYFRYQFSTPGNDYPKLGVMNDAYYATIRNFSGAFNLDAAAMDRAKMLVGNPGATIVIRNMSALLPGIDGFLPADVDGFSAPATGGVFLGFQSAQSRLAQFDMVPNFANPGLTTLTGPNFLPVNPINSTIGSIPQPAPGGNLDALSGFMMFRLAFRDMGTHFAMVANHTVDVNNFNNHAGIRWYELRNSGGGWSVFQQGTYAPDNDHRWMGSIAMDANGNIAMSYTVSNSNLFPSIRYTGRLAGDPLGQMTLAEGTIISGAGSQTNTSRWGDYSSISVDPSNDMTFWATHEYVQTTGSFNWWTRIASFNADTNPPNLVVTMTPVGPPPVIQPPGSFQYDVTVTNIGGPGSATMNVQLWTFAVRSTGGQTDALFGPISLSLAPGQSFSQRNTQNIPLVDAGSFQYIGAVGVPNVLPANIFASDSFPLTILAAPSGASLAKGDVPSEWQAVASAGGAAEGAVPASISLQRNYPNPFNPTTEIRYDLSAPTKVRLTIYNTLGQEVKTLVNDFQPAGSKNVRWDATNDAGRTVSAGVYLYRLEAGGVVQTRKMTLTK